MDVDIDEHRIRQALRSQQAACRRQVDIRRPGEERAVRLRIVDKAQRMDGTAHRHRQRPDVSRTQFAAAEPAYLRTGCRPHFAQAHHTRSKGRRHTALELHLVSAFRQLHAQGGSRRLRRQGGRHREVADADGYVQRQSGMDRQSDVHGERQGIHAPAPVAGRRSAAVSVEDFCRSQG